MKLALSGRLWETPQGPSKTLTEQIALAAELGYRGFEIRYPMLPAQADWEATRVALQKHNLELVFAPGAGMPSTDDARDDLVRMLDTIAFLGGSFLKIIPQTEADHDAMRLAADLGAERGIRVLSQYHSNSRTDTVEKTESFFETLEHPNLGLIFDACHLPFSEATSIKEAIERLWPWIELVNLQSYKPAAPDDGLQHAAINGRDWSLALPGDPAGTDLGKTIQVLKGKGYNGWWTVMPAVDSTMDPLHVAKAYYDFAKPLLS